MLEWRKSKRRKEHYRKNIMYCLQPPFPILLLCSEGKIKKKKKEFDVKTGKKRGQEEGIFSFL